MKVTTDISKNLNTVWNKISVMKSDSANWEHHQRTSSQRFYNLLYNKVTTNRKKFATSQHLDVSRCWALALRCGKFVVESL